MSSALCQCKEEIRRYAGDLGAIRCGFARAHAVPDDEYERYLDFVRRGYHGEMAYLDRYHEVRRDPELLLAGVKTIISCAFAYRLDPDTCIASYAHGPDYHTEIKSRLYRLGQYVVERFGGSVRACVDTAPILERYWAQQASVGYIADNHLLVVPGYGSAVLLGELLWTAEVEPDEPMRQECRHCGKCRQVCPTGALTAAGSFCAAKCQSYLTIEHRGELPEGVKLQKYVYGCDFCQLVCPENEPSDAKMLFEAEKAISKLTADEIIAMTPEEYRKRLKHTAIERAKLPQLVRNAMYRRLNKC